MRIPRQGEPFQPMLVLHANWIQGALHLWGESLSAYLTSPRFVEEKNKPRRTGNGSAAADHPFAASADELHAVLSPLPFFTSPAVNPATLRLRLPCDSQGPWPSDRLARRSGAVEMPEDPWLGEFDVPGVAIPADRALYLLQQIEQASAPEPAMVDHSPAEDSAAPSSDALPALEFCQSVRFFISAAHFALDLLSSQRFIPTIMQIRGEGMRAAWQPWLSDEDARRRVAALLRAMPPSVRAAVDSNQSNAWSILDESLRSFINAFVRRVLVSENFHEALEDRDPAADAHVAWLTGLLGTSNTIVTNGDGGMSLLRDASLWVRRLEDVGQDRPMRLCLKLTEPDAADDAEPIWRLSLHLQMQDHARLLLDAADIWSQSAGSVQRTGVENAQDLLLSELGRAARIYPRIETALAEKHPTTLSLTTADAYDFLREYTPLLMESGFDVIVPEWWDQPVGRLAARLHIDAPGAQHVESAAGGLTSTSSMLGLNSLVKFNWQIAIGDQPLTLEEFQTLARQTDGAPLVRVRGRWIEINSEQLAAARELLQRNPSGEMTLLEAIRIAHGADPEAGVQARLPVLGMDATGWVADLLAASSASGEGQRMPLLDQPAGFHGELRPYQKTGLSWLAFLDRFGLGACLADDMGLGKTIQLIALLLHEREQGEEVGASSARIVGPTLLIVPTSVLANWTRELQRFAPSLEAIVHHGPDRSSGSAFVELALQHDVVITTYPLVSRDVETLKKVRWHRVVLDEAQYIKNPPTKQTSAIRALQSPHRLALTGTPVENRLSELWSIMEFCNPGYLGHATEFRRRFGIPIERHHNRLQAENLRQMVRPFVLRRVKTDPKVIDDLPNLTETKEYATLTAEQAALYQQTVDAMLNQVDRSEGIQRRGLVLATLVKLKQICNHPEQARQSDEIQVANGEALDGDSSLIARHASLAKLSSRSGKARRLMVMLEEVIASGEKALIFTQFRKMGHLLTAMIQNDLDCEALFLHGGTPANKRQHLIDRFQSESGGVPIFVLSLKAGGLGLNLTAANHVFHFDRWWNPAVENQATDRAFRIGQMRAVQVHKFVCLGTLEERIDQMIEQKTELADNIIGAGEQWLTELSTTQLHDLLMLRPSAVEVES